MHTQWYPAGARVSCIPAKITRQPFFPICPLDIPSSKTVSLVHPIRHSLNQVKYSVTHQETGTAPRNLIIEMPILIWPPGHLLSWLPAEQRWLMRRVKPGCKLLLFQPILEKDRMGMSQPTLGTPNDYTQRWPLLYPALSAFVFHDNPSYNRHNKM